MAERFILERPEQIGLATKPQAATHAWPEGPIDTAFRACSVEDARSILRKLALDLFKMH